MQIDIGVIEALTVEGRSIEATLKCEAVTVQQNQQGQIIWFDQCFCLVFAVYTYHAMLEYIFPC